MEGYVVRLLKSFGLIKLAREVVYLGCHDGNHVFCHVDGYVIRVDVAAGRFEILGA